ncbi:MAG: deoxyribose-phosphate aldolase [Pseudomonadota bacterium]
MSVDADARKQAATRALPMVDLTDLSDTCDAAAIETLCTRAQTPHGNVGAICIWPGFVSQAAKLLDSTTIPIATVVNFPGGGDTEDAVRTLTEQALADGAREIDLVMPYRAFAAGRTAEATSMVRTIRSATSESALLKVILETGEFRKVQHGNERIREASRLAIGEGADFIKTSTGKVMVNATLDAAQIMLGVIAETGGTAGFKPAGGIKTTEDTADYLSIADTLLGSDWANPSRFRFGASGVVDDLLAALDGTTAAKTHGY